VFRPATSPPIATDLNTIHQEECHDHDYGNGNDTYNDNHNNNDKVTGTFFEERAEEVIRASFIAYGYDFIRIIPIPSLDLPPAATSMVAGEGEGLVGSV
jgi:hypothetical protein